MIEIDIPGFRVLQLAHLVFDYNGTLAVNGGLIDKMNSQLSELANRLSILTSRQRRIYRPRVGGHSPTNSTFPLSSTDSSRTAKPHSRCKCFNTS